MNIFNVALCIRAFLFFSYPSTMTGDSVWVSTNSILGVGNNLPDSFTAATPLGELAQHTPITYSISDMIVGFIPGSIGGNKCYCNCNRCYYIIVDRYCKLENNV